MNIKWGIAFGVTALVLSLFVSLAAGNNILVSFLRGLISGVLFGGLGLGLHYLLAHYLPEVLALVPGSSAGTSEQAEEKEGVDFRMPEVMPAEGETAATEGAQAASADAAPVGADGFPEVEPRGATEGAEATPGGANGFPEAAPSEEASPEPVPEEDPALDGEPAVEAGAEAMVDLPPVQAPAPRRRAGKVTEEEGFLVLGEAHKIPSDPEQLAKAVRTIMHQDE